MRALVVALAAGLMLPAATAARLLNAGGDSRTAGEVAVERLARGGVTVYCGGRGRRLVALTFDDGPGPYSRALAAELRRSHARGTFFLVGERLAWWHGALRAEAAVGAIGVHTWTHARLSTLDTRGLQAEIGRTRGAEIARTGRHIALFRPPYGTRTPSADAYLRRLGVLQVLWDVEDSAQGIRPGSIVLLHENRSETLPRLRAIVRDLARRRLRAVTVPELLAASPPRLTHDSRGSRTAC